jgi:hypothetical protein
MYDEWPDHSSPNSNNIAGIPMKSSFFRIICLLVFLNPPARAEDVLLHELPEIVMPIASLASAEKVGEELVFRKQFFIAGEVLEKLPAARMEIEDIPVGAAHAVEAAVRSLDFEGRGFRVRRMELLASAGAKPVDFYLIEMLVNGSSEHRIVLMDGSVIRPRLRNIKK